MTTATALLLALLPAAGAAGSSGTVAPAPERAFPSGPSGLQGGSLLRDLRRVAAGTFPEDTLALGEEPPAPLGPGAVVTLDTADVDGDGDLELIQVRGTASQPKLAVTDGVTGSAVWVKSMPSYSFVPRVLPDGGGTADLLLLVSGTMQRLDGATGATHWSRPSSGAFLGLSPTPDGGDLVTGRWTAPDDVTYRLTVAFNSWETGSARGSLSVDGTLDYPSAALAGDLDGDGIGDLFTLAPTYLYGAASGGTLRAVTQRGATTRWEVPLHIPTTDYTFLVDGSDVTGDGQGDAVLFSEWLGAPGLPAEDLVTVVDGQGGTTAGLEPAVSVALQGFPVSLVTPGDLNGDGGEDLVFSGAVYFPGDGVGAVMFESVGRSGVLWRASPGYPASFSDFGFGWWPDGGDLDGDGTSDAVVLLGSLSEGVDRAAGVSLRTGAVLWTHDELNGAWVSPTYADADGDGGDDVLDEMWGDHPDLTTTRFGFTAASGRDLRPFWSHERSLDSGANGWSIYVSGGNLGAGGEDVVVEYIMQGGGRHFAETLRGADGALRWSDPA